MKDMHTRRAFIGRGLTILSAAGTLPLFIQRTAAAMNPPGDLPLTQTAAGRGDNRILVILQLGGGNDGLSTVIPVDNDDYRRARPRLAITNNLLSLGANSHLALHPNLTGFKSLYDQGHLGIILGVGYPNPNRSHFRSMAIWQTGEPAKQGQHGWLGRYFDAQCAGADPVKPTAAVNIGPLAPMTLSGKQFQAVSFQNPEAFQWSPGRSEKQLKTAYQQINDIIGGGPGLSGNPTLNFLERTAMDAQVSGHQIRQATERVHNLSAYPRTELGKSLAVVAKMIRANMPTRVYYVSLGGFDTHAGEQAPHDALMTMLSSALYAFINDLKAQGNLDRTLVMTFSEFGRRVAENASAGTDHGTAAPMFVMGGAVKPGIMGVQPSLAPDHLDLGDLRFSTDFRSVYASILTGWLQTDASTILNGSFKKLPILKT